MDNSRKQEEDFGCEDHELSSHEEGNNSGEPRRQVSGLYPYGCSSLCQSPISKINTDNPIIAPFRGQVSDFARFEQEFKRYVESSITADHIRYYYLERLCIGDARIAVECCSYAPKGTLYVTAMNELRKWYGQEHMLASVLIKELFAVARDTNDSAASMTRLSTKMKETWMALSQTEHTADLNSIFTLEQIVDYLPMETRDRWVKWKDEIYKPGKRIYFDDLRLFIDSEVRIRQGRIGMPTPVIKIKLTG